MFSESEKHSNILKLTVIEPRSLIINGTELVQAQLHLKSYKECVPMKFISKVLYLSCPRSLSLFVSLSLSLSLSLSPLSLSLSIYLSISLSLSLSLSHSLGHLDSLCLSLNLSSSIFHSRSLSIYLLLPFSVSRLPFFYY